MLQDYSHVVAALIPLPVMDNAVDEGDVIMSVGDATLDDDHRRFFSLVRMFRDCPGGPIHELVTSSMLFILEQYVDGHFRREEGAMALVDFPGLAEHAALHAKFRDRIATITRQYRAGCLSAVDGLPALVEGWLKAHILIEDMKYTRWIRSDLVDRRHVAMLSIDSP